MLSKQLCRFSHPVGVRFISSTHFCSAPKTMIEKILEPFSPDPIVQGAFVLIRPHKVMTHDNTGAVIPKFESIAKEAPVHDKDQIVFTLDHDVQNTSETNLKKFAKIAAFAKEKGISNVYGAGMGIGHQIMIEQGYAFPYTLTVASDSHSNMYGGIGAVGTPVVRSDAAAIWTTGSTWWQVPSIVKVELTGSLPEYATGKDVIVTLCGMFCNDEVLNAAVEFTGEGVKSLSVDDRLTISNMTTEWGALAGVFPVDDITVSWLESQQTKLGPSHPRINAESLQKLVESPIRADPDAYYAKHLTLDLSTVSPFVSGPNSVKKASPLADLEAQNIKVHKAYLVSCVNSRLSDLEAAANVFAETNGKVADGVEFYIAPASKSVQAEAEKKGVWQTLLKSGAKPLPAGCGPCIGLGAGLLKDGEVGISATNRNYKGRMGSPLATAYLASPEVVAASAIAGHICGPLSLQTSGSRIPAYQTPKISITENTIRPPTTTDSTSPVKGFPAQLDGQFIFCDQDNLNTDAIYPGKYTYQDDMTPSHMAQVVMENYDPSFASQVNQGDILVSGFNFGTGSSREQAATSLLYAGIKLVIAGSFSQTFKRNAINNGLLVLECPDLVRALRSLLRSRSTLTDRVPVQVRIDLLAGKIHLTPSEDAFKVLNKEYDLPKVGRVAQELVVEGGLDKWVKNRLH